MRGQIENTRSPYARAAIHAFLGEKDPALTWLEKALEVRDASLPTPRVDPMGQWVLRELGRHGYEVSPGTLYPLLARMQARGWLRCESDPQAGPRARKEYSLTHEGRKVLAMLRRQVTELYREVVLGEHLRSSAASKEKRATRLKHPPSRAGKGGPR